MVKINSTLLTSETVTLVGLIALMSGVKNLQVNWKALGFFHFFSSPVSEQCTPYRWVN